MRALRLIVIVLIVGTLATMTMFPADSGEGTFHAVNGPTTIFQAWRAALLLLWIVVAAALASTPYRMMLALSPSKYDRTALTCTMLC